LLTLAEVHMTAASGVDEGPLFLGHANRQGRWEFNRGLCFAQNKTAHSLVRRGFL